MISRTETYSNTSPIATPIGIGMLLLAVLYVVFVTKQKRWAAAFLALPLIFSLGVIAEKHMPVMQTPGVYLCLAASIVGMIAAFLARKQKAQDQSRTSA